MKKLLLNSALILVSALIALTLHVGMSPPGMIPDTDAVNAGDGSGLMVDLDGFEIVGVTDELDASDAAKVSNRIALLWKNFYDDAELQSVIDWSQSNTVYAVYKPANLQHSVISLTIGLAPNRLSRQVEREPIDVPSGQYQHFRLTGVDYDEVNAVWQQLYSNVARPEVVIERYALDRLGEVQQIQIQAMFQ